MLPAGRTLRARRFAPVHLAPLGSIVALADQISREFKVSDQGIAIEIEFNDNAQEATGAKLCLQLKSGDCRQYHVTKWAAYSVSYPRKRRATGRKSSRSRSRVVQKTGEYWMAQASRCCWSFAIRKVESAGWKMEGAARSTAA